MPPLKPSKLVIKMEKRALERREKREKLMEIKKEKEKIYKELMLKQKQMEIDKVNEAKRLEKEKKIQKLQKQRRLKEIESNKLILSQMHYKRALILYYGWIPWMQRIEQNNLNFHKLAVIRDSNLQKQVSYQFIFCIFCLMCMIQIVLGFMDSSHQKEKSAGFQCKGSSMHRSENDEQ